MPARWTFADAEVRSWTFADLDNEVGDRLGIAVRKRLLSGRESTIMNGIVVMRRVTD